MSQIQPLRIQKSTPATSPGRASATPVQRPLAELSPIERRRNSSSFNQTPTMLDSSPFDSSPFASKFNTSPFTAGSPRSYWQNRDSPGSTANVENQNPREPDTSPAKRSSIENLKRASRVKNSNIFALEQKQEYDPASLSLIERPLASGRPLAAAPPPGLPPGLPARNGASDGKGLFANMRRNPETSKAPVALNLSQVSLKASTVSEPLRSPLHASTAPGKSAMSQTSRFAQAPDAEDPVWSEDESSSGRQLPPGRSLHRRGKSVAFDEAPPLINEYELVTPELSSIASGSRQGSYGFGEDEVEGFELGQQMEREDSFDPSLEDTDKTPVVLPEDWRFMTSEAASDALAVDVDDPFTGNRGSPGPNAIPRSVASRLSPNRTDSLDSNGERRPLPPLPPPPSFSRSRSDSGGSLPTAEERTGSAQWDMPLLPRPASIAKAELQNTGGCSVPMEERLRLMALEDDETDGRATQAAADGTHAGRAVSAEKGSAKEIKIFEDDPSEGEEGDDVAELGEYDSPPKISRESILRKVRGQKALGEHAHASPEPASSPEGDSLATLDPDVPLPSLGEQPAAYFDEEESVMIKEEDGDLEDGIDIRTIPELYPQTQEQATTPRAQYADFSLLRPQPDGPHEDEEGEEEEDAADDDESQYSTDITGESKALPESRPHSSATEDGGPPTPRAVESLTSERPKEKKVGHRMSLPRFASTLSEEDFGQSLSAYFTPSHPDCEPVKAAQPLSQLGSYVVLERPITPVEQLRPPRIPGYSSEELDEPRTPESVIRHPISDSSSSPSQAPSRESSQAPSRESSQELFVIPEPVATVRSASGTFKTRPSPAPANTRTMAETRRQVSGSIPPRPERSPSRPPTVPEADSFMADEQEEAEEREEREEVEERGRHPGQPMRQTQRLSSLKPLEISVDKLDEGLSFGLDKEFDRVMETQKRGYLLRQNTKVIVASSASNESTGDAAPGSRVPSRSRGTRSAGNSPRKQIPDEILETKPWNGKTKRKSIRQSGGLPSEEITESTSRPGTSGGGLSSVAEDSLSQEAAEDGVEKGRLFVKVIGVKELDLPLPRNERSYFALTLDNGLHCVTTSWLELGRNAPIGQEFELVVLNDLEFQLTLSTKLEQPKPVKAVIEAVTKPAAPPKKSSAFSRVFGAPKKRKEQELREQEEAQRLARQRQSLEQLRRAPPTAWDLLHNLVAQDGTFARSYISLKDHESQAYGRPFTVDVPCFNEWAMEDVRTTNSVRSGRTANTVASTQQRRAPYKVGKLELQLLFVPKPKDARDEDMPKSMNACVRELQEAEKTSSQTFEGHLSQQGGDCPYWRRRFFRLSGSKLTAYHETTHQPRATINLGKASKLIDDKSSLTQNTTTAKNGGRRKSAFANEEDGYMFVEEGFRVRFANGETIDFYADSAAEKDAWMKVLSEVVGRENREAKSWTGAVLRREATLRRKERDARAPQQPQQQQQKQTEQHQQHQQQRQYEAGPPRQASTQRRPVSHQPTPHGSRSEMVLPPLPSKDPRAMAAAAERRAKARSGIF